MRPPLGVSAVWAIASDEHKKTANPTERMSVDPFAADGRRSPLVRTSSEGLSGEDPTAERRHVWGGPMPAAT
jgi:hypothetical protein